MSKRYGETIEVETSGASVEAFWWRGRRYQVRRVLGRWRETGGWWRASGEAEKPWLAGDAREIVRLEAIGRAPGTYEIARDLRDGAWTLFRIWD